MLWTTQRGCGIVSAESLFWTTTEPFVDAA
jgi:hypothetical protein